ncbi:MAG TPA: hypothetical protein V6D48_03605 [Oculatellaceae cyanobacterium]
MSDHQKAGEYLSSAVAVKAGLDFMQIYAWLCLSDKANFAGY